LAQTLWHYKKNATINHRVPLTLLDDDFREWLFGNTPTAKQINTHIENNAPAKRLTVS